MRFPMLREVSALESLVREIGFLPLFKSAVEGFSVEELTPPDHWFQDGVEGPWTWREKIAERGEIAYAKLFERKAGFVSRDWYPVFANWRRDGFDFDARYESGLASVRNKAIVDMLSARDSMLSSELRAGMGEKGFDGALTVLQMQTYVTVRAFEYKRDKDLKPYGWGVGRYALSEKVFGEEFIRSRYDEEPSRSKEKIFRHLSALNPAAPAEAIIRLL